MLRRGHGRRRARRGPSEHHPVLPAQGGPRELDRVLAGRVSLGHYSTVQAPLTGRHGRGEAEVAPQLEPRSWHSVSLRVARDSTSRSPATLRIHKLCILVVQDGDSFTLWEWLIGLYPSRFSGFLALINSELGTGRGFGPRGIGF